MHWLQGNAVIALILLGGVCAFGQEREERRSGASRFSDPGDGESLPPIVEKSSVKVASAPSASKSEPFTGPKLKPTFTPVDPRDHQALLEPTTIIAIVGGYHIITGDVLGDVNLTIDPEAWKQLRPDELENLQVAYLRIYLQQAINMKLLYISFMRQERASELFARVESHVSAKFDEQVQDAFTKVIAADTFDSRQELNKIDPAFRRIAELMVRENLSTMGEVDVALAKYGTSLAKERKRFAERMAGMLVLGRLNGAIGPGGSGKSSKSEPTREQLLEYYETHLAEFERPARAKWEKLSVRHSRFNNRAAALAAIAEMGDDVYLRGAPFAAVARRASQTADAADGGFHDWTGKGALRSEVLDKAIFTLPVGQLSDILEDDEGLHIVRVIERDDGGYQPFNHVKTQELIRTKLQEAQLQQLREDYLAKLRSEIAVWSIFDEQPEE